MIPANVITKLKAWQAQTAAAAPLASAPFATLKAIQLNGQQLETDTTSALYAAVGNLDSWVAPAATPSAIAGFQAIVSSAIDQWRLDDMLNVISRANLNVDIVLGSSS
jgi:hypothetical protein